MTFIKSKIIAPFVYEIYKFQNLQSDSSIEISFITSRPGHQHLYNHTPRERSGSVVECLTRDRRAAGLSLTGVTALWSLSKTHLSYLSTGSTQEDPFRITERLLSGLKNQIKIKQTNKTTIHQLSVKVQINSHVNLFLFDLILYVPSTIFQLNSDGSSWVEPVLSLDKCVLLKDHNAVTPLRLEPTALRSRVKHSTTEPLHSLSHIRLRTVPKVIKIFSS